MTRPLSLVCSLTGVGGAHLVIQRGSLTPNLDVVKLGTGVRIGRGGNSEGSVRTGHVYKRAEPDDSCFNGPVRDHLKFPFPAL